MGYYYDDDEVDNKLNEIKLGFDDIQTKLLSLLLVK